ncbi:Fic family protein [Patescibacteria group bacterium]
MSFNPTQPNKLPNLPPQIDFKNQDFSDLLMKARTELAELKGYTFSLPNPMLLISPILLRESLSSSEIENINTTVINVLQSQLFPEIERKKEDKEVLHYREATLWGFENINKYSISTRTIQGIEKKLIPESQGEYRKLQNAIVNSGTREVLYTPPISSEIPNLLSNWENFVNEKNENIDPLIKCAIAHYQFESIHPFDDGNGRTGRVLMILQLVNDKILKLPTLYISGYINKNRPEYYRLLRNVTINDGWNNFIIFMLKGFYEQAKETKEILFAIMSLFFEFKKDIKEKHRKIYSADLVEELFSFPVTTPVHLAKNLKLHYTTTSKYLNELKKGGFLKDAIHGKYHFFANEKLIKLMHGK